MSKKLKIVHRRYDCIGCSACVNVAPDYWSIEPESDGRANLLEGVEKREEMFVGDGFEMDRSRLEESAEVCPVNCIDIMK